MICEWSSSSKDVTRRLRAPSHLAKCHGSVERRTICPPLESGRGTESSFSQINCSKNHDPESHTRNLPIQYEPDMRPYLALRATLSSGSPTFPKIRLTSLRSCSSKIPRAKTRAIRAHGVHAPIALKAAMSILITTKTKQENKNRAILSTISRSLACKREYKHE